MTTYDTRMESLAVSAPKASVSLDKPAEEWRNTFAARPVPAPFVSKAVRPWGRQIIDELLIGAGIACTAVLTVLTLLVIAGLAGWYN